MLDFLKYIFLFLGIFGAIILGIALFNIYSKSYKPKNSLGVLVILLSLFLINGIMTLDALNRTINSFNNQININIPATNSNSSSNKLF
jgi:hypothetical protein